MKTGDFLCEIAAFISRLSSFNDFFQHHFWQAQFSHRSRANAGEVSTDSNFLAKTLNTYNSKFISTYSGAINSSFWKKLVKRQKSRNEWCDFTKKFTSKNSPYTIHSNDRKRKVNRNPVNLQCAISVLIAVTSHKRWWKKPWLAP